jgi:hypothetical protein
MLAAASLLLTLVPAAAADGDVSDPISLDALDPGTVAPVDGPQHYRACLTVFAPWTDVHNCQYTCQGVNVIVGRPGACHDPTGAGCEGITVIVDSPQSCFGGPGKPGCVGTTIIDPFSPGSCVGGPGKKILDVLLPIVDQLQVGSDALVISPEATA